MYVHVYVERCQIHPGSDHRDTWCFGPDVPLVALRKQPLHIHLSAFGCPKKYCTGLWRRSTGVTAVEIGAKAGASCSGPILSPFICITQKNLISITVASSCNGGMEHDPQILQGNERLVHASPHGQFFFSYGLSGIIGLSFLGLSSLDTLA